MRCKPDSFFILNSKEKLSVEDADLQERMDHLTSEIASITRYAMGCSLRSKDDFVPTQGEVSPAAGVSPDLTAIPSLMVSDTQGDVFTLDGESSWEREEPIETDSSGWRRRGACSPQPLDLRGGEGEGGTSPHRKWSLESCGSLADSEGSLSQVVVASTTTTTTTSSQKKFSSLTAEEDDVFLTNPEF